jgi:predicted nuclease with TOPRIM domain
MALHQLWDKVVGIFSASAEPAAVSQGSPSTATPRPATPPAETPASDYQPTHEESSPDAEDRTPRPKEPRRTLSKVADELQRQQANFQQLLDRLDALPDAQAQLAEAVETQRALPERIAKALADSELTRRNDDLAETLTDLSSEAGRQCDLLGEIRQELSTARQNQDKLAGAVERLADTAESTRRANAGHVELMEQIRDHLANSNADLVDAFTAQNRRQVRATTALAILAGGILLALLANLVL